MAAHFSLLGLTLGAPALHASCASVEAEVRGIRGDNAGELQGWLSWRGPAQNGTSNETGLPDEVQLDGKNHLWSVALSGRGTPVIAGGRVYVMGYRGKGPTIREVFACLDEDTGELIFERTYPDFLSDSVYSRYAVASPTIDPATGNVFFMTTPGLLCATTADGEPLWERELLSEIGRLTFPNGRTGSVVIDGDLAILHTVNSHWGPNGPARDRFFAFDKHTGEMVWHCTPGIGPKDNPYSHPVLEWRGGRRVLYAGTGCGHVVAIDARSGDPLWRFQMAVGGVCASVVLDGDRLIALHGLENIDSSSLGRMVALKLGAEPAAGEAGPVVLGKDSELWRNDIGAFSSSPVLAGGRVYQTDEDGELNCVDVETGEILWQHKLAGDQVHASPLWADGKLYVPMNDGGFWIIRPTDEGPEVLQELKLEGNCLGAPAVWNGKIWVHTTAKLYCFGAAERGDRVLQASIRAQPDVSELGPAVRLQVIPADFVLRRGDSLRFRVRSLDALGAVVEEEVTGVTWGDGGLGLAIADDGSLEIPSDGALGTGVVTASAGALSGSARARVLPVPPLRQDFESIPLTREDPDNPEAKLGNTPAQWIHGFPKWDVRVVDGSKVAAKTLNIPLFQRTMGFVGHPDTANVTVRADVMSDGNRRTLGAVGLVNQRYMVVIKGNYQELEVSSNMERIKQSVPFKMKAGQWYSLETRVDMGEDGSATVRAKAWPRGEEPPDDWTIEVVDPYGHDHGAPGTYGFAPQSRFRVYIDNLEVIPNE